jgi:hypothetical protein
MTCRKKAISPEQWMDFVEGTAGDLERESLKVHMDGCANCREIHERLLLSKDVLSAAAPSESIPDATASRLMNSLSFRIRRLAGPDQPTDFAAVQQLRSILVSMCGEGAADRALNKALARSGSNMNSQFARNLSSIVEVMCGTRAARLVEHAAQSIRQDKVA